MHPLDLSYVAQVKLSNGKAGTACIASIVDIGPFGLNDRVDWLMGDTFLRNVYSVCVTTFCI